MTWNTGYLASIVLEADPAESGFERVVHALNVPAEVDVIAATGGKLWEGSDPRRTYPLFSID